MSIPFHVPVSTKPDSFTTEGYHRARCISLVQIGTVFIVDKWQGQIRITWELVDELRSYSKDRPSEKRPKQISKEYTMSLYGKSWLKAHLIGWMGEDFLLKLTHSFDPYLILGEPCLLKIVHKQSSRLKWYEDIEEIQSADGMEVPEAFNPLRKLVFSDWDKEVFDSLPVFVRNKIIRSREFIEMFGAQDPIVDRTENEETPF